MKYSYSSDKKTYEDFASGSVLLSAPGYPGFPARLASEIFSIAKATLDTQEPLRIYDPLCGTGQLLTS